MPSAHRDHRGLASALGFLRAAREDRGLTARLAELDPHDGLESVVGLAAKEGFVLCVGELRAAHRVDWALRRARYADGNAASAASTVAVVNRASSST